MFDNPYTFFIAILFSLVGYSAWRYGKNTGSARHFNMFIQPTLHQSLFRSWREKHIPRRAAALAYYSIVSLAPLIIILVSLLKPWLHNIHEKILFQINYFMGPVGSEVASQILSHIGDSKKTGLALIFSFLFLFLGTNGVFTELHDSCDSIWEIKPRYQGLKGFFRKRLISLIMLAIITLFLLFLVTVSTVLPAISPLITGGTQAIVHAIDLAFSIIILSILFAAAFRLIPSIKISWKDVWGGAILTSLFFTLGKTLLGLYFGKFTSTSAYGVAGSFVAFLIWVYYSSQIFYLGVEYTRTYAYELGSLKNKKDFTSQKNSRKDK